MNRDAGFDSGVVVVQPIADGMVEMLNGQGGLYNLNLQGIERGQRVDTVELIDVITRGINPYAQFEEFLRLADNPEMRFVISNTTEAGIVFDEACRLDDAPCSSYPGKLTQLLWRRYLTFGGDPTKGFIILPCELIFHNGTELKKCIEQYIDLWGLGEEFRRWFETACGVYCTLVDRIVPGYPKDNIEALTDSIGYEDRLMVKGEIFHLWVIEAPRSVADEFPACEAGLNVLFVPSEAPYHDRKVTLLNGPHTVLSPVAYLSGLDTVRQACEDPLVGRFVRRVMYDELLETLNLPRAELTAFADSVMERFLNPFVDHFVTSIMLNSFPKFRTRDLPGLKTYLSRRGKLPAGLVLGLAAIIVYYKGGTRGTDRIVPDDDRRIIDLLQRLWATGDADMVARGVLSAEFIWGEDLTLIPDLVEKLTSHITAIEARGMRAAVETIA